MTKSLIFQDYLDGSIMRLSQPAHQLPLSSHLGLMARQVVGVLAMTGSR